MGLTWNCPASPIKGRKEAIQSNLILKGRTWQPEANAAGKVIFDNFVMTR